MAKRHKENPMSYDKLSLASFKAALKEGKYESATGARRAVGKATTLSDAEKDTARKAIDAHFGASATVAPKKTAAKKVAAKKTAAPKKTAAAAAPKKEAVKAAPKKKAAHAKVASAKRTPVHAQAQVPSASVSGLSFDLDNIQSVGTQVRLAEKTIQNVGAALNVITQTKKEFPDADLQSVVEEMGTTLQGAVGIFRSVVNQIAKTETGNLPAIQQPKVPSLTENGIVNTGVPTRGESLFQESAPSAEHAQG